MMDEMMCPDCDNEMTDIRNDGRVYCDCCDSMFYAWEVDPKYKNKAEWQAAKKASE